MELARCYACMGKLNTPGGVCPQCGFDNSAGLHTQPGHALPCGTVLAGHYLVGRVIGQGGFGITYIAWNLSLDIPVCIKEYFPAGAAVRSPGQNGFVLWGSGESAEALKRRRESFVKEARKAAKLSDLSSIVKVWDVFYENETAYIVMNHVAGETLKSFLVKSGRPMEEKYCLSLLTPVMRDLDQVHARGIIHRDIKPDNLMLTPDGTIVLLDMGAAKDLSGGCEQSSFMVASQGFTPLEQYNRNGIIGAWTDVYAMCATIYYCVTGKLIPSPTERLSGEKIDFRTLSPAMTDTLERGLAIKPEDRIQSMFELETAFRTTKTSTDSAGYWYRDRYKAALTFMEEERYSEAEKVFNELGNYRDSQALAKECREKEPLSHQENSTIESAAAESDQKNENAAPKPGRREKSSRLLGIMVILLAILSAVLWTSSAGKTNHTLQVLTPMGKTETTTADTANNGKKFEEGSRFFEVGEYDKALDAFQEAAAAGNAAAMTGIGILYEKGLGVGNNYAIAMEWFQKAADAGDSTAMFWIGWNYYYELGVEKSYATALDWCLRAAEAGNAAAMNWVSDMYRYGQGTSVDIARAEEWRQRAVDAGYTAE
jgi:serine/threonine protein kinase